MAKSKLLVSNKVDVNQDSDDAMADDNQVGNYKGVFYGDETEQRYYEGGAHFPYKEMCRILNKVLNNLSPSRRGFNPDDTGKYILFT